MNRLLLISIVSLLYFNVTAQPVKVEFALNSGLSVPLFEYSQKNLDKGCFTMAGFYAGGELRTQIKKGFGAFIQGGIDLNPVDVSSLGYEKVQADPFLIDVYVRSEPYQVINLLGGASYQYPLTEKIKLECQIGAGTFFSKTPYQFYKPEYFPIGPAYFEITSSNDVSFAYGAGLKAIYEPNPWYQLALSANLKRSKAEFDFYSGGRIRTDVRQISMLGVYLNLILKLHGE